MSWGLYQKVVRSTTFVHEVAKISVHRVYKRCNTSMMKLNVRDKPAKPVVCLAHIDF